MYKIFCLVFLLSIFSQTILAKSDLTQSLKTFEDSTVNHIREKIFLHIDRPSYLAGETLWFKINLVEGKSHKPLELSKVVYLEIVDDNSVPPIQTKVSVSGGFGHGNVYLPLTLKSGKYVVRAYTNWMKNFGSENFFEQEISIINTMYKSEVTEGTQDLAQSIQFFPEGGHLVNGIKSKVAFRVIDYNGEGIDFKGAIVNEDNDTVVLFNPSKFGIGHFYYTPQKGENVKAIIQTGTDRIISNKLPIAIENGYVMHVEGNEEELVISIDSNVDFEENISLVVHSKSGSVWYGKKVIRDGKAAFIINKNTLEEGVSRITIFDSETKPLAERLYFKYPKSILAINTSLEDKSFLQREKVTIDLSLQKDNLDTLLSSELSMAVYLVDSLNSTQENNIFHYLWLSSELKGKIESPDYYFEKIKDETVQHMDNLMLTHGWRKFELINKSVDQNSYRFIPEYEGLTIHGTIGNGDDISYSKIPLYLAATGEMVQLYGSRANEQGHFYFVTKNLFGKQKLVIQSNRHKDIKSLRLTLQNPFSKEITSRKFESVYLPPTYKSSIRARHIHMQTHNIYWNAENNKIAASVIDSTDFYDRVDNTYILDNYTRFPTMEEVMREFIPEVIVRKQDNNFIFRIVKEPQEIHMDNPLVLINNIPVFDINKIIEYNPLLVKRIDIIKDGFILEGEILLKGVINYRTYTNSLEEVNLDPAVTVIDYEGLQLPRIFYSPMYGDNVHDQSKPDFRNLLFWEPAINISGTESKEITFYTSDLPGKYIGVIQGVSNNGNVGYTSFSFDVNEKTVSKK